MILKRLEPNECFFGSVDLTGGYYQIPLHEESKDLFCTGDKIRGEPEYFKNIDDILT